ESEADLLSHEHFALWYLSSPGTYFVAREIVAAGTSLPYELSHETWQILWPSIIRLAHEEFIPEMRAKYATRLRLMSEWLFFAGQHREGALAASAARTMIQSPPEVNLFVLRLVQKGILVALSKLP
ncbi:MAG TPA: hypothetical protein VM409_02195, partial [Chloroflexia bacterium]|nr:hypothetical protein [Chloroflexia bacterium]